MADHPLRPATDRRLGGPLPRLLANRTQAHPTPINLSSTPDVQGHDIRYYPRVGTAIPECGADCLRVTHPFAAMYCYTARLACIRHATSVRSEPGSNSSLIFKVLVPFTNQVRIQVDFQEFSWAVTKHISDSFNLPGGLAGLRTPLSEGEANYRTFWKQKQGG